MRPQAAAAHFPQEQVGVVLFVQLWLKRFEYWKCAALFFFSFIPSLSASVPCPPDVYPGSELGALRGLGFPPISLRWNTNS